MRICNKKHEREQSDTPFIIIRSISDSPNEENQIDFNKYLKMAADRCAIFIENLMNAN